ncbi:unnamed protein product [Nezara viridula]|uniref:Protein-S-isoprenylcysteine O-methyltransferase n=1 Tax=Nezara viridula TaxID=85310 RepID=A0A9P0HGP6_NEZVI|nr:unnamed protein product [Nezara viridula]
MSIVYAGKLSLLCFISPIFSLNFLLLRYVLQIFIAQNLILETTYLSFAYFILLNVILRIFLKDFLYEVGVRALLLGSFFSIGILVAFLAPDSYKVFGWYLSVLTFFHYSEFLAIAISNPETLSVKSYILNHSVDYQIAALASWIEFFVERYFYPDLKLTWWVSACGLLTCIAGEVLRKTAIIQARSGFTHIVQNKRKPDHKLVTTGVYAWTRHPSYVGWFYWAIATQIILVNPICILAYTLASWKFFNDRIIIEELTLLSFFGDDYIEYQKKVPTGLPFIKGYLIDNYQDPD